MADLMPVIFLGHGNPMNALAKNDYTDGWASIGRAIPRPKAVIAVSAHRYVQACAVTANLMPRTIHDFGGVNDLGLKDNNSGNSRQGGVQ